MTSSGKSISWRLAMHIVRQVLPDGLGDLIFGENARGPVLGIFLDLWPKRHKIKTNYFTSSDPHRDIILKHIRHKFWHSFCPSVSRFHQNYPLLLVPSPGSGSSSDHCDLSSQTDSNWLSLCLIQNNFRRPGVSRRLGVWRRLGAWKLRFERYKTIWLS